MFIIDENVSELEVLRLRKAGIRVRLVGDEVAKSGDADEDIVPVLLRLKRPVFFTQDGDFFDFRWAHRRYALIWINSHPNALAKFVRGFLQHPAFDTQSKRMGVVARVRTGGISYWRVGNRQLENLAWTARLAESD